MHALTNFVKDINIAKISGINRLLVIDIFSEALHLVYFERTEPWYVIRKSGCHTPAKIAATEIVPYSTSSGNPAELIKQFVNNFNIKNIATVVSLNEGKLIPISMPEGTDEPDDWLDDAVQRSIPGGRIQEFSYSVYREELLEDSPQNFSLLLMRRQAVSDAIKTVHQVPVKLHAVTSAAFEFRCTAELPAVYFQFTESALHFFLYQYGKSPLHGTEYLTGSSIDAYLHATVAARQTLQGLLRPGQHFMPIFASGDEGIPMHQQQAIHTAFADILSDEIVKKNHPHIGAAFIAERVMSERDTFFNLLPIESRQEIDAENDRQFTNRIVLATGLLMFFLLFCIQLSEIWLQDYENSLQEELAGVQNYSAEIKRLARDNDLLKKNLSFIGGIRNTNKKFTPALASLSSIVSSRSCLTSVACKELARNNVSLEIIGYAINRHDITNLISLMEGVKNFSRITLKKSEISTGAEIPEDVEMPADELVTFTITAEYASFTH